MFKNTSSPGHRRIDVYLDGNYYNGVGSVDNAQGTWPFDVATACLAVGSHALKARASGQDCVNGEYDEKEVTIQGGGTPTISASAGAPANGLTPITVTYAFPNTSAEDQRKVDVLLDGTRIGGFASSTSASNSFVINASIACGTGNHDLRLIATRCAGTLHPEVADNTQTVTAAACPQLVDLSCGNDPDNSCSIRTAGVPSPSAAEPTPCVGAPVNVGSGDIAVNLPLFAIDGPMPIDFTLTYHSQAPLFESYNKRPFGVGWTHTFNQRIGKIGPNRLAWTTRGGSQVFFDRASDEIWVATFPSRFHQLLTQVDTEYRIKDVNGTTTSFDATSGKWLRTEDRWGNRISGSYDSQTDLLIGITDAVGRVISISYSGNFLQTITLPDGATWQFDGNTGIFDPLHTGSIPWRTITYDFGSGLLTAVLDEAGKALERHTYLNGRGVSSSSEGGRDLVTIEYDTPAAGQSRVTRSIDNAVSQVTVYSLSYDKGRFIPTDISGGCPSCGNPSDHDAYTWNSAGNAITRVDGSGMTTSYSYDANGNVTTQIEAVGTSLERTTTAFRTMASWPAFVTEVHRPSAASSGLAISTASWNANETLLTSSRQGWLSSTGSSVTYTTTQTYDARHRLIAVDGPRTDVADTETREYYSDTDSNLRLRGRLHKVTNAVGLITTFNDYDIYGRATSITDPNGVVTDYVADAVGRVTSSIARAVTGDTNEPTDYTTTYHYDGRDRLSDTITPRGTKTLFSYEDGTNRLTDTIRLDDAGNQVVRRHVVFNLAGGRASEELQACVSPASTCGSWTTQYSEQFTYDTKNRLSLLTYAGGAGVAYTYDSLGQLLTVKDENHASANTTYSYDALRRLKTVVQTLGTGAVTTSYGYDAHDNLASVVDPNGNLTAYQYDDFGRIQKQTSVVTGVTTYAYDPAGNMTSSTDANTATTSRSYDAIGRLLTTVSTRSGLPSESTSRSYDDATVGFYGKGRLTSVTEPTGTTTWRYERRGLLSREAKAIGSNSYVTTFGYDANGNRTSIGYPSGRVVTYTFDFADRPWSASAGASTIVSSATYQPFGPQAVVVFGNGTTQTMSRDARYLPQENKLIGPGSVTVADYTYGHDAAGNITAIHDAVDHTYDRDFGYDDLNRLTSANSGSSLWGTGSYDYDAMGNLLSLSLGTRTATFAYDGATPKLTNVAENGVGKRVEVDATGNEVRVGSSTYQYSPRGLLGAAGSLLYTYDSRGVRTTTDAPCPGGVTPSTLHAPAGGLSGTLVIAAPADCTWAASGVASWVTLGGTVSGAGPGTMTWTVAPNSGTTGRTTAITLSGDMSVAVTQPGSTMTNTSVDVNGDGVTDLLWRNDFTGEVRVFGLDSLGVATTMSLPTHSNLMVKLVGVGDFDGDGHSDLLWRNGRTGDLSLDLVAAGGTVTSASVTPEPTTFSHVAGIGDLDGDGRADLVWRNEQTGALSARIMNGATTVSTGSIATSTALESVVAGVGDLNGDGRVDIVSYDRRSGEVYGRLMAGATVVSQGIITTEPDTYWRIAALGDVDGDGKADLIWRDRSTGAVGIQLMSGLTAATRVAISVDPDTRWMLAGTGDADGDGRADLLWRHRGTGAVRVDLMNGTQIASSGTVYTEPDLGWRLITPASAASSQDAARADFAADGTSDLMWRNTGTTPGTATNEIGMWEMNGTTVLNGDTVATLTDPNQSLQSAGDFNGDGTSDLLWRNRLTNWLSIWNMNGHTLSNGHSLALLGDANWQVQAVGDVTGDGVADVVLRNTGTTPGVALWEMKGGLLFRGDVIATLADANWQVQGIGDFFGEGQAAILWRNASTGVVAIWQINARAITGTSVATVDSAWVIQGVGDYNGDGRADILWRDSNNYVYVWEMNGGTVTRIVTVGHLVDANWKIKATTGDYGGDRTWDILLQHAVSGTLAMWQMKASEIGSGATFASAGAGWTMEALERNGDSGASVNALSATPTPVPTPQKNWWTPLPNGPVFWGPPMAALPMPPWIAGPPALEQIQFWTGPISLPGPSWWTPVTSASPPPVTGTPPTAPTLPPVTGSLLAASTEDEGARRRVSSGPENMMTTRITAQTTYSTSRRYSLYTPELNLLAETEKTTTTTPAIQYEYIWFAGRPAAQIENTTGTIHYYFNDDLGTPVLTTNASGSVDWRIEREPYGTQFALRNGATRYQPLSFPGQEDDGNSDRSYNIFRWYRAGWGRYTQSDPIGLASGANLFAYVKGNPLNAFDPFGLWKAGKANPNENTVVCRGGKAVPQIVNEPPPDVKKCVGDCLGREHELSHKADIDRESPDVCQGKPDGVGVIGDTPKQTFDSEVRAWTTTISCLQIRKAGDLGGDCSCQAYIDYYLDWALQQRDLYRFMSRSAK